MEIGDTTHKEAELSESENMRWCEQAVRELAESKGITAEECERRLRGWFDTLNYLAHLDHMEYLKGLPAESIFDIMFGGSS